MALGWKNQYLKYRRYSLNILSFYQKRDDLKMFLEIILSLGTVIVFGIFALKPTVLTVTQLYQEIKNKENLIKKLDVKLEALNKAQAILAKEVDTAAALNQALGSFPRPDLFAYQIEKINEKNGTALVSLNFSDITLKGAPTKEKAKPKNAKALPGNAAGSAFTLTVTGNYANLISFLTDLEKLRMPVVIDAYNLSKGKSKDNPVLSLALNGRLIYLPKEEATK